MLIISQKAKLLRITPEPLNLIEMAGRTCYRSHMSINDREREDFVRRLIDRGHESVLEHSWATMELVTDRGVMAELTRHRLSSFSIESTRYCKYEGELLFIRPFRSTHPKYMEWIEAMKYAEETYKDMLKECLPQEARSVLPNSLATHIVVTANFRQWRHILRMRLDKAAHPMIRNLMALCCVLLQKKCRVVFDEFNVGWLDYLEGENELVELAE